MQTTLQLKPVIVSTFIYINLFTVETISIETVIANTAEPNVSIGAECIWITVGLTCLTFIDKSSTLSTITSESFDTCACETICSSVIGGTDSSTLSTVVGIILTWVSWL